MIHTTTITITITNIYHTPLAAYFTNSVINMPLPFDTVTNANKHTTNTAITAQPADPVLIQL